MIEPVYAAVAAGLALGAVVGFRVGMALVRRIGGPFARKPVVIGCAALGGLGVFVPAAMFSLLIGVSLGGTPGEAAVAGVAVRSGSLAVLFGIAAGIALVVGSGVVVGSFAGAFCGRLIEGLRSGT